jgi:NAD(P)-dependent dehydrogenase (short-subunit alcohol dehydrogenase family)
VNDRVVLVTGGAGNLGRVVTSAFLRAGARVAIPLYKTDQAGTLDRLKQEHGGRLHTFGIDLTTERGAEQAVQQVVEWGGRVDSVAQLTGGYIGGSRLAETPVEAWDRMMDLNLKSAWLVSRFALPRMVQQGGGSLVFVSSRAAVRERSGHGAYAVARSAVITLAEVIAEEYAAEGVRANVVLPGTIDTEANRLASPDADHSRWTPPEQIAEAIVFLASSASAAINGAAIPVYGRS